MIGVVGFEKKIKRLEKQYDINDSALMKLEQLLAKALSKTPQDLDAKIRLYETGPDRFRAVVRSLRLV